ncbi:hypothetical protein CEP54_012287 [Fusarium duplospermum]|uniref:Uncharacterized protein n=1 Tax=Fusarium duplospermum TaxID=1325734 RepID=A0A428P9G7_9HYPO|nr:hypothetical protein CEP54_012287 [Fusarium duplospermum]
MCSPKMNHLQKVPSPNPRYGRKCLECKARIVGRAAFKRHVERHAKLAEIIESNKNNNVKWVEDPGFDVDLVRDMYMSTPAKYRHFGGEFTTGPMADKGFIEGIPKIFFATGRVRRAYEWVKKDLKPDRFAFRALQNTNTGTEVPQTPEPRVLRKRKAKSPVSPL